MNYLLDTAIGRRDHPVISVIGNYVQWAAATLDIYVYLNQLFGQLSIGGTARLAGTLTIDLQLGYVPANGDNDIVLTAAGGLGGTQFGVPPAGWTTTYPAPGNSVKVTW
jgi:hypothetical protein